MVPYQLTENINDSLYTSSNGYFVPQSATSASVISVSSARPDGPALLGFPHQVQWSGGSLQAGSPHLFPFLRGHIPVLLSIQCLKTVASYLMSRFLVVHGGRASPFPAHLSWGTCQEEICMWNRMTSFCSTKWGSVWALFEHSQNPGKNFLKTCTYYFATLI